MSLGIDFFRNFYPHKFICVEYLSSLVDLYWWANETSCRSAFDVDHWKAPEI